MFTIYKATFPSGKIYIEFTSKKLSKKKITSKMGFCLNNTKTYKKAEDVLIKFNLIRRATRGERSHHKNYKFIFKDEN